MSRVLSQIWKEEGEERKVLFLDEPVSHLDVKYQYQLLRVVKEFCQQNVTIIVILHNINLAISFADRILFMKEEEIKHTLTHATQLTSAIVEDVFGVSSFIIHTEAHAKLIVVF